MSFGATRIANAPPRHREGFGDAVDRHRAVKQLWLDGGDGVELTVVEDKVLIDVIGDDVDMGVPQQHICHRLQFFLGVDDACRIGRLAKHDPLGLWRDRLFKVFGGHAETTVLRAIDEYGRAACKLDHIWVARPIRARNDHFVASAHGRHQHVEQHLLGTGADTDFIQAIVQAIVALELKLGGFAHFQRAVDGRVARFIPVHRLHDSPLHMERRREVRLAGCQLHDVPALAHKFAHTRWVAIWLGEGLKRLMRGAKKLLRSVMASGVPAGGESS